jgi:glycosyltransferase involved in cell wall biosynthesis
MKRPARGICDNMKSLMIFINDPLSELFGKGEITERYYNPGNLFDEIHIIMVNDDKADPEKLQKTAGKAKLYIHNLPISREVFLKSLAWRPTLLKFWARPALELAERVKPLLIRCHGNSLNGIPPRLIKQRMGIPYLVSLHTNPDVDPSGRRRVLKQRVLAKAMTAVEKSVLQDADRVLPVYKSIIPYLRRLGINEYEVAYNVLNPGNLGKKEDYGIRGRVRIVSVSRQIPGKNPEYLIRSLRAIPEAELTLVGDGPLHGYLQEVAKSAQVSERVIFRKAVPNDELCASLPQYDIFAAHTDYWEISKSVLEPLLAGLPIVINKGEGRNVPEFEGDFLLKAENSESGYGGALRSLIENRTFREQLGRSAFSHSQALWNPAKTEENYVRIYQEVMDRAHRKNELKVFQSA